jgi:hypothetical protein
MNGKEIVSRFLEAEAKQDVQGMADVLAEDIVFEIPFALPGLPGRVEGKGTVVEFLKQFLGKEHGMFTGWDIYNIRIYPGGDPGLFLHRIGWVRCGNPKWVSLPAKVYHLVSCLRRTYQPLARILKSHSVARGDCFHAKQGRI